MRSPRRRRSRSPGSARFWVAMRGVLAASLLSAIGAAHAATLTGSEWKPLRMGELAVPAESSAFVQFRSKGRLGGYSGCNRLFAEYEAGHDGYLFIGPGAATRMAWAESVMLRESRLAAALEQARRFERNGTLLVLFDALDQPILEMRQVDWD